MSAANSGRSRRWKTIAVVSIVLLGTIAALAAYVLLPNVPVTYSDPQERFKYGSFGTEAHSLPLPNWGALPDRCPDLPPGGCATPRPVCEVQDPQPGRSHPRQRDPVS